MEIRLLRYFLAVAEELHFGKAAEKLNISQPPLSQQIMKFEDDLGVKLFVRHKRKVQLTEAGTMLKAEAIKILRSIDHAHDRVTAAAQGKRGNLSLGYATLAMDGNLPYIIREFKSRFPDILLTLHEMSTADQLESIRRKELHVGVVRLFGEILPEFVTRPLQKEKYVLAIPSGHRLSKKRTVTVGDLAREPLIALPRDAKPRLYEEWLKIFREEGFSPNIVQETYSKHTSVSLVAAGIGLAFIPESTARLKRKGVVFKKVRGKLPALGTNIVYLKGQKTPILENFLSIL